MDSQQETYQTTAQQHFYKGHEMKNLFFTLFILCFVGCIPPQETETEWKSNPEYRAFIATRMAESIINYQKNIDEETVEELCDGSGWIVHGDGHRTECPGCDACESKSQEPDIEWSDESMQVNEILEEFEIPIQVEPEPIITDTEVKVKTKRKGPVRNLFRR